MNWLITGGCGFIGVQLAKTLRARNPDINIRLIDNLTIGQPEDLVLENIAYQQIDISTINGAPNGVELVAADIRNGADMVKAAQGCDTIVHLAAHAGVIPSIEDPQFDMETNVLGTFNMLEAARKNDVKNFMFASSGAALGRVPQPVDETRVPNPASPYGASKATGEMYCKAYGHSYDININMLRFSNVYGWGSFRKSSVVAQFIRQALQGEALTVNGDGTQLRDYIYIDDLVRGLIMTVESGMSGEVFQMATQVETSVGEIAALVKDAVEAATDLSVTVTNKPALKGDEQRGTANIEKIRETLGFDPEVHLPAGIAKTVDYFLKLQAERGTMVPERISA